MHNRLRFANLTPSLHLEWGYDVDDKYDIMYEFIDNLNNFDVLPLKVIYSIFTRMSSFHMIFQTNIN